MKKKIYIISTFHNEEQCINEFINRINNSFKKFKHIDYKLIFIDDFSDDLTNSLIKKACIKNKKIKLITLKKRYGLDPSIQTGFDFVSNKKFAVIMNCDLQERPELIAQNFSKIKNEQTLHFVRKESEDPFFQRFYTMIAYLILHFISKGKIIMLAGHFKIIPPSVVRKIKKNTDAHPYWNYLITKYSSQNKIVYYSKKKRTYGSSKFNIFALNPWIAFFSAIHFFRKRFINMILVLLLLSFSILFLVFYNFYNVVLIVFLSIFSCFLIANLIISYFVMYYKKKKRRIFCKYK